MCASKAHLNSQSAMLGAFYYLLFTTSEACKELSDAPAPSDRYYVCSWGFTPQSNLGFSVWRGLKPPKTKLQDFEGFSRPRDCGCFTNEVTGFCALGSGMRGTT